MSLTEQDINVLLKGVETAGDSCLQLCQFLTSHGVDVRAQSSKICHISLELQKLLAQSAVDHPWPAVVKEPISIQYPEFSTLTEPCILQPNDPRIAKIKSLRIFQDLQRAVRAGNASSQFPVGTIIPDIWTDNAAGIAYLIPHIVVDYREVTLAGHTKRLGATLLRQNALPVKFRFDKDTSIFAESELRYRLNDDTEGYAAGCSANLLEVVSNVIIDGDTQVRFFLPLPEELHFDPYNNPKLKYLVWEYFRDAPASIGEPSHKRIFFDPSGTAQDCWLRSATRGFANRVWIARMAGSAYNDLAYGTCACAPACVIA